MENQTESMPWLLTKIGGVWAMVGVTSWSEAASFLAFIYTAYLLTARIWKDAMRPMFERLGWVKPKAGK